MGPKTYQEVILKSGSSSPKEGNGEHAVERAVPDRHIEKSTHPAWSGFVSRLVRLLMGIGVVSILAPAIALVLPQHGDEHAAPGTAQALAAMERDPTLSIVGPNATIAPSSVDTAASFGIPPTKSSVEAEEDTATTVGHQESHREHDVDDGQANDRSSTTASSNPPKSATSISWTGQNSGTITGSVCPCNVTGIAELKGDVILQGDLIVDGGSLVARPGVNVEGNGFQIMFMNGGKADFQGSKVFTWSDRGAKQNLQRDIEFRNMRRIMWMGKAGASTLKYFTVRDSGTSTVGDYPLHWHLNGNSTRGTVVEGVVVVNGKNHAYVPHGSHGITFKDVIAKNTKGDAFWWDPPGTNDCNERDRFCTADNSNDIIWDHALVDTVTNGPGDERGFRLAGFVLGAGSGNVIRNSSAINIAPTHVRSCSGFHWPEGIGHNVGGSTWTFQNNQSLNPSGCHGIFVWQNTSERHVVENFSGGGIEHGAYGNSYEYRGIDVPYAEVHAAGWSVDGGRIGTVITKKHRQDTTPTVTFRDVAIDRLVIRNAGDSGEIAGHYVFQNTGLTCNDVEYQLAVPGTKVIIDGTEC
jgi:hypothetical protein